MIVEIRTDVLSHSLLYHELSKDSPELTQILSDLFTNGAKRPQVWEVLHGQGFYPLSSTSWAVSTEKGILGELVDLFHLPEASEEEDDLVALKARIVNHKAFTDETSRVTTDVPHWEEASGG